MKRVVIPKPHSLPLLLFYIFAACSMIGTLITASATAQGNPFTQVATIQGPSDGIASLVISPDGQTIAYGNYADNLIRIVDVSTLNEIRTLSGHTNAVTGLAFSPNGQHLASTGTVNLGEPYDGTVRVWDIASGTQLAMVETNPAGTSELAFSPDGTMLAGASGGNPLAVNLWETATLSIMRSITGVFRMVAFSPDGSRFATGKRDSRVYLIDTSNGNEITNYGGHTGWIQTVSYNSDGKLLATGGEDRTIQIRDAQNGQTISTLMGHLSYPENLSFSPDASFMASLGSGVNITRVGGSISIGISNADRFLRMWDLNTLTELPRLNTESDALSDISFSADWNILVTGSDLGVIRIFQQSGTGVTTKQQLPLTFEALQNYPNPFNPETEICFKLSRHEHAVLKIYGSLGEEVRTLLDERLNAGYHHFRWDGHDRYGNPVPSGVYIYQLATDTFSQTKLMSLVR